MPGDELRTLTLGRLILDLAYTPASASATNRAVLKLTVCIGVATTAAVAAGVGSLPSPFSNVEFPARGWLYKGMMFQVMENETGVVEILLPEIRHLDLGAMRKLDNGVLFLVAGQELVSGTDYPTDLTGHCRFMCFT